MKKRFLTKIFIVGGILALGTFVYLSDDDEYLKSNTVWSKILNRPIREIARFMLNSKTTKIDHKIPDSNPGKGLGRNFVKTDFHQKQYTIVNTSSEDIFIDYSNTESLESFICASSSGATGNNKFTSYPLSLHRF